MKNIEVLESTNKTGEIDVGDYFLGSYYNVGVGRGNPEVRQLVSTGQGNYGVYTPSKGFVRGISDTKRGSLYFYCDIEPVKVEELTLKVRKI